MGKYDGKGDREEEWSGENGRRLRHGAADKFRIMQNSESRIRVSNV